MFQKLENKIKRTLFLFFSLFILLINLAAFCTTFHNMHENAIQLSLSYIKQQEQSFHLRIQLLEETANLFLQHDLLGENLLSGDRNGNLTSLVDDYLQSSLYLSSIQIYTVNGHRYFSRTSNAPLSYHDIDMIVSRQGQEDSSVSLWHIRNVATDVSPYGYLTYITGIYSGSEKFLGYLVFNIDLRRIFGLFDTGESGPFKIETLAIQTETGQRISAGDTALFQKTASRIEEDYAITDRLLVYQIHIPKSGDCILIAVPADTLQDYMVPGLICLFSVAVFILIGYFAIRALSDSIILPLQSLYHKIRHFLNFKQ